MIDLHCHILPGLDDGAKDIQDSIAMARQAEDDGIEVVCATPHIRSDHNVQIAQIAERVRVLQEALEDRGLGVQLAPGGELAQRQADGLSEEELRAVAIGGKGGWVLLEPAPGPLSDDLERTVSRLARRGLSSIVAHPERHAAEDFEQRLRRLVSHGCVIQWTAEFVTAPGPREFVLRVAREGLVHVLGSDAHSARVGRPVNLAGAFAQLASVCSPQRMRWMRQDAPRAILRGEPVSPMP